jgi:hypothetical protein
MAVAFQGVATAPGTGAGVTTVSCTMTVSAGSNLALIVGLCVGGSSTGFSVKWDTAGANQTMTLIGSKASSDSAIQVLLFGLVNPTPGASKTITATWTTANNCAIDAIAFTGVNQTGGATSFAHATSANGTGTAASTGAITSSVSDYVCAGITAATVALNSVDHTSWWTVSSTGGNYSAGASTVTLGGTFASSCNWAAFGVDVVAAVSSAPAYDTSLPPVRPKLTDVDSLQTAYQPGSHGAKAPTGPIEASLPPLGRGPSVDLRTSFQTGFKGAPIATQPQWNYNPSSDLPPRLARPSAEPTWIVPGQHGAPAQTQNDDTPLPPRGRGATIDLGTWAGPGFIAHGSIATGPIEASLPPLGRGSSPDLRTAVQSGFVSQGAGAQTQNQTDLPPVRARGSPEPTWTVSGQVIVALVQPVPAYDTSLPPLGRGPSIDLRTSFQAGSHGAVAQTQNDDALPPRGRGPAVDLAWTVSGQAVAQLAQTPFYDTSLPPLGRAPSVDLRTSYQSGAHGAVAQTQNDDALPPRGRGAAVDLSWTVSGTVVVQLAPVPAYDTALPPLGRGRAIDLGTSYQAGSQGAQAQTQNDTELPPRGRGPAIDLTWNISGQVVIQLAQVPFYDTSLPPFGRSLSVDKLTWSESLNPGGPFTPPAPPAGSTADTHDGGHFRRYSVGQWAQIQGWLKDRREKRKEEEAKAALAKVAIAAIDEVEAPQAKPPRRPLPLSTKARRKLREALVKPLPPPIVALAVTTATVLEIKAPGPTFAERRAQLRAEWEAVLAEHERAIEEEDEEAVVQLFMHMIND